MRHVLATLAAFLALAAVGVGLARADGPLSDPEAWEIVAAYADWDAATAFRIAVCESRLTPTARNGRYRGLYQLGEEYDSLVQGDIYDPRENTRVAHEVYLRWGKTWGAWRACL